MRPCTRMPDVGLCAKCAFKKLVVSDRGSEFVRCTKPELPKYPRLPVLACVGFEDTAVAGHDADPD
jgi:hypothetical protein